MAPSFSNLDITENFTHLSPYRRGRTSQYSLDRIGEPVSSRCTVGVSVFWPSVVGSKELGCEADQSRLSNVKVRG